MPRSWLPKPSKLRQSRSTLPRPGKSQKGFDPMLFMSHVVEEVKRDINGGKSPGKNK